MVCFSKTHAQGQSQFFVDDVESIAYITVKVCVDTDAKVSSVAVVKDKTTYNNNTYTEYIKQSLMGITYFKSSNHKEYCYDRTYSFINSKYKKKKLNEADCNACKKFKKGVFKYAYIAFSDVRVERNHRVQKEIVPEGMSVFSIKWISNCSYILSYKRSSFPEREHLKDEEIYVDIIDVLDDTSYVYKTEASFRQGTHYGIFKKIEE